ncbi:hypothetical protein [Rhizobium rhizogenes]|uniref:hypothetical protein n=1 Tax=Rhizobium rhizogenes TaxID=359 RepID=UPI001571EF1C|nr:hypothetical protein [Rhizobium rhizogenes]NTF67722.1 hypothetical protein [Rhizobium rhizogenes]
MMTPLTENPAVVDPRKMLTKPQQNALGAICFFRHQVLRNGKWQIGNKRFEVQTVRALEDMELVRRTRAGLEPTTGGAIAAARLKAGGANGTA